MTRIVSARKHESRPGPVSLALKQHPHHVPPSESHFTVTHKRIAGEGEGEGGTSELRVYLKTHVTMAL